MTKVLFISAWYPHRNDVMSGLFVRKHAEAVAIYANVAVLYVVVDKNINRAEITTNTDKNITEIIVYFPASHRKYFRRTAVFMNFAKAYLKGFQLLHKVWGKPGILQANVFTRTAVVAYIYKLLYRKPYVVIEHWTRYFRSKTFDNYIHKLISQLVARKAAAVLPVTAHLQTNMLRHGMKNSNYVVVNNVVDDFFIAEKVIVKNGKKILLNVSCFDDEQKNLTGLLNVVEEIYKSRQDFVLYLVGTGADFDLIQTKATEKGLTNKAVVFTGMLQGENLADLFMKSDFTVMFSNYENIPVVISESLVCGKPVISSNVGGISEHIDDGNGILVERNDEKALTSAILWMLDHYETYDSASIAKQAKDKYSFHAVGQHLYSIYKEVLSESSQNHKQVTGKKHSSL